VIHADLTVGADVQSAQALTANLKLASAGVIPHGAGMQLTPRWNLTHPSNLTAMGVT
jgi:hypothetical protein